MAFPKFKTKDEIPEALRPHYVERDGMWHPTIEGEEADPKGFRERNITLEREKREALAEIERTKKALEAFNGIDPANAKAQAAVLAQLAEEDELKSLGPNPTVEQLRRHLATMAEKRAQPAIQTERAAREARDRAYAELEQKHSAARAKLARGELQSSLVEALNAHGAKLRKNTLEPLLGVVEKHWAYGDDDKLTSRNLYDKDGKQVPTIAAWVPQLVKDAEWAFEGASGTGAEGGLGQRAGLNQPPKGTRVDGDGMLVLPADSALPKS